MRWPFRIAYHTAVALGRPIGGLRPRRLYDLLARRAFPRPEFAWSRNRWGHELLLSPYYHIDRNILILGTYDLALHLALARLLKPGMIAMDVGANLGEMSLHMAQLVGPSGKVYAFEPAPPTYQRLAEHVARNNLTDIISPHALALSDQTGTVELAYADADADNQGLASIANLTAKAGPLRATVPTMTLDDFTTREQFQRLDLIKIDIQGAEGRFLIGARQTLARFRPALLMEFSPDDLHHAGQTSQDLARLLQSLGYQIRALTRRGGLGPLIPIESVAPTFSATNVLCTARG